MQESNLHFEFVKSVAEAFLGYLKALPRFNNVINGIPLQQIACEIKIRMFPHSFKRDGLTAPVNIAGVLECLLYIALQEKIITSYFYNKATNEINYNQQQYENLVCGMPKLIELAFGEYKEYCSQHRSDNGYYANTYFSLSSNSCHVDADVLKQIEALLFLNAQKDTRIFYLSAQQNNNTHLLHLHNMYPPACPGVEKEIQNQLWQCTLSDVVDLKSFIVTLRENIGEKNALIHKLETSNSNFNNYSRTFFNSGNKQPSGQSSIEQQEWGLEKTNNC